MRTYNLHLSKNFPAGPTVKDALKVLQDPQESIRLSPVISSVEPDPTRGDGHFIVTEKVPIIGSIYYPTKYKTNWRSMLDGCEWEVEASFGTKIRSRSKVKEENGVVVFTEDLDAEVSPIREPEGIQPDLLTTDAGTTNATFEENIKGCTHQAPGQAG